MTTTTHKHTKTTPNVSVSSATTTVPTSPVVTPVGTPPTDTSAPAATSQPVVISPPPSTLVIPTVPVGYVASSLEDYAGYYARANEVAALANALTEVSQSTTYEADFGGLAPSVPVFVQTLQVAEQWSGVRVALEPFVAYVKSEEAVAWKAGRAKIEQLNAVFQLVVAQNAEVAEKYPALARLLDVRRVTAKKGAATAKRNKATKAAEAATSATSAVSAPSAQGAAVSPGTPATTVTSTGTGGAAR